MKNYDKKLIENILRYIKDTDDIEKQFAFELIDKDLRKHTIMMNKHNMFNDILTDKDARKRAKIFWKTEFKKDLASVINVLVETEIEGVKYYLTTKIAAPLKLYCESLIKRKMHKYLNKSQLTYIKLEKQNSETTTEILIELGDIKKENHEFK